MPWPRTSSLRYGHTDVGPVRQLAVDGSTGSSAQRRRPPRAVTDAADPSPAAAAPAAFHRANTERHGLRDNYGIADTDLGPLYGQPNAGGGLPPVDLDLVDGVVDRGVTVDGGGRELLALETAPLSPRRRPMKNGAPSPAFSPATRHDVDTITSTVPAPPRRVNFDSGSESAVRRPPCQCARTLPGSTADRCWPYLFKLDDPDAPVAVTTSLTTDRSPLISAGGRPVTSDIRHSDVITASQCREQFK